jgi:hypothetical protein
MAEIEKGLHTIEDDLAETWLEDWAQAGVLEIEALLVKHLAFLAFLETVGNDQEEDSAWSQAA